MKLNKSNNSIPQIQILDYKYKIFKFTLLIVSYCRYVVIADPYQKVVLYIMQKEQNKSPLICNLLQGNVYSRRANDML